MKVMIPLQSLFISLFLLYSAVFSQDTVSIGDALGGQHSCVGWCLVVTNQLVAFMGCAAPFENYCYCATAAASASRATSFITSCASSACSSGDIDHDLSSMSSIYISYCRAAGYTALTVTTSAEPSETTSTVTTTAQPGGTDASQPPQTTTQVTVVTQTALNSGTSEARSQGKYMLLLAMVPLVLL
jgi:hypothetical protein